MESGKENRSTNQWQGRTWYECAIRSVVRAGLYYGSGFMV